MLPSQYRRQLLFSVVPFFLGRQQSWCHGTGAAVFGRSFGGALVCRGVERGIPLLRGSNPFHFRSRAETSPLFRLMCNVPLLVLRIWFYVIQVLIVNSVFEKYFYHHF